MSTGKIYVSENCIIFKTNRHNVAHHKKKTKEKGLMDKKILRTTELELQSLIIKLKNFFKIF